MLRDLHRLGTDLARRAISTIVDLTTEIEQLQDHILELGEHD